MYVCTVCMYVCVYVRVAVLGMKSNIIPLCMSTVLLHSKHCSPELPVGGAHMCYVELSGVHEPMLCRSSLLTKVLCYSAFDAIIQSKYEQNNVRFLPKSATFMYICMSHFIMHPWGHKYTQSITALSDRCNCLGDAVYTHST